MHHLYPALRSLLITLCLFAALGAVNTDLARGTTAQTYRKMADASVAQGRFEQAVQYYRLEAAIYRKIGEGDAARVEERKADRWSTSLSLFASLPASRDGMLGLYSGAKFEPVYGCYLGGYVEADDRLQNVVDGRGKAMYPEEAFSALLGKQVATFFVYCHYGEDDFPRWAGQLSRRGMTPHIALEPNNGLDAVQDNEYLQNFARAAAACSGPVFLRFAAEMNGDWTAYHSDPALYRSKFKLVHDVMARLAPNVAMIWCPNCIPDDNIDSYYPGDDAVDWVGVNFYSVLHHNNRSSAPALENPVSMLDIIYHRYAARKPIAICEYGASHREALLPDVDQSETASLRLAELFGALPRLYPRVKLIDIFDCDNLSHARPGRKLNDYSISDSASVLDTFRRVVAPDYYLSQVYTSSVQQKDLPAYVQPLHAGMALRGHVALSAAVRTYDDDAVVVYSLDGKIIGRSHAQGDYSLDLNTLQFPSGAHILTLTAYDSHVRRVGRKDVPVVFRR